MVQSMLAKKGCRQHDLQRTACDPAFPGIRWDPVESSMAVIVGHGGPSSDSGRHNLPCLGLGNRLQRFWLFLTKRSLSGRCQIKTLVWIFMKLFQNILNQHEILRFFIPILNMFKKMFWLLFALFSKRGRNGSKNPKTYFSNVSKNLSKRNWRTWIKVKKEHSSVTFLLIPFFVWNLFKIFSMDSKSASNSAFFDTKMHFWKINFLDHITAFCKLLDQMRTKRLKKMKTYFINVP